MSGITGSKVGITMAAMSAALMAIVDISIVNVALSDIRASFGTPLDQIAWVSTGYMMANVVVIPMTGWLQRRFGYRRYFVASILIFLLASILCGLSWNLPSLVAFRILQGCGGGAIIPTAQSILFARYPKSEHGMASALFGIGAMTGPLLGPTLGGYLIDISNWHWIFFINIPIGLFAAFMTLAHVKEEEFQPLTTGLDRYGVVLLAVGMASMQYVLEEGNAHEWFSSTMICFLAAIATCALITFVIHELETPNPVVDLRVFANRSYTAATGVNFLIGTVLFSASFLFSLYCGTVMRYKALDIGLLFLKGSAIQVVIMPIIGKVVGKVDSRYMVSFGILMLTASLWLNSQYTNQSSDVQLLTPIFIRAIGLCFIFVPLSVVALSDLPNEQRGNATGLFNLTRELGGSIGTAAMNSMLEHSTARNYQFLTGHVNNLNPLAREQLVALQAGSGWKFINAEAGALAILQLRINLQSLIKAFNESFAILAVLFLASLILVLLLKKPDASAPIPDAH